MVDAVGLDLLEALLVALEGRFDRREQLLELGLARLVGLAEPLAGLVEEVLVRLLQQFVPDLAELRHERIAAVGQILHPLLKRARIGLERGEIARGIAVRVALVADLVELEPKRFDCCLGLLAPSASP